MPGCGGELAIDLRLGRVDETSIGGPKVVFEHFPRVPLQFRVGISGTWKTFTPTTQTVYIECNKRLSIEKVGASGFYDILDPASW
jgi:hypothetical protein